MLSNIAARTIERAARRYEKQMMAGGKQIDVLRLVAGAQRSNKIDDKSAVNIRARCVAQILTPIDDRPSVAWRVPIGERHAAVGEHRRDNRVCADHRAIATKAETRPAAGWHRCLKMDALKKYANMCLA